MMMIELKRTTERGEKIRDSEEYNRGEFLVRRPGARAHIENTMKRRSRRRRRKDIKNKEKRIRQVYERVSIEHPGHA